MDFSPILKADTADLAGRKGRRKTKPIPVQSIATLAAQMRGDNNPAAVYAKAQPGTIAGFPTEAPSY